MFACVCVCFEAIVCCVVVVVAACLVFFVAFIQFFSSLSDFSFASHSCLYNTFASPWADGPARRDPDYYIPTCYYVQQPLQSPLLKMSLFSEETLFYIFHSMPRDVLQAAAAAEL